MRVDAVPNLVTSTVERGVATLTLDSSHNRNALSAGLVAQLGEALAAAAADPGVRAVVLTHSGRVFCAGADLTEAAGGGVAEGTARLLGLLRAIVELPKPVVARVDGQVRAGGLGLLGACDIVLAGPASGFAFTEARLGVAPAVISLTTLTRMPERAAARYYLTGEVFDAAAAVACGLVTLAGDDVDALLAEVLAGLRAASPQGLAASKLLTTAAVRRALDEHGTRLAEESARLFATDEAIEGMTAFLQRRKPSWAA
ncbi:enoyl-CoA hydratase family protein [Catellatospora citrea]|uniref:Enoyl-CoA hydratase n=1 Tax=Catellatospora citrea TaxID=53366 RepID=A0A8J3KER0_9ACTN|nr:enoyl-CoA hydratase family protein [Catellatospora citrea]RKE06690.1 enoyl-CoA hydratase [Catellatospora citrea]GIF98686.1 enoyl-CoA hydratase [Catellatospora citrea]